MKTLIVLCCLLTAGCTATMLDYDFEGYQNGESVGGVLPGPDSIGVITVSEGDPTLYVAEASNALSGQKSLQLERALPRRAVANPSN